MPQMGPMWWLIFPFVMVVFVMVVLFLHDSFLSGSSVKVLDKEEMKMKKW